MKAELGTELHLIDHYQQSLDKAKTLLSRIEASNQQPCFVLAPRRCGQEELLKAFAEIHEQALELTVFEVRENGSCQEVRRLMLTEFLSNKQEREELREKSEELREKSEEGKEKTGGSGVERLALLTFIPWLDDEASRGLSDAIDEFLLQGYRVLVFCPAQNDRYQNLQSDRLEISALELKLAGYFTPLAYEDCLKRFLNEFLPLQIRLAAVLAAFLGRCTLKELSQLNYELHSDIPRLLEELHPLFTVVDSGCGIKADPVSLGHFEHDIAQVITEYLQTEGLQANTSVVASRITMLSITLLERGDLESSHQILEIAEALIKKEARGARSLGSPNKSSEPGLGAMSLDSNTAPSPYFAPLPQAGVLPLTVQLFGKLEICKEGVPLRNKYLTRSKVRRFVAFLVLNQPRMVSRESVVEYLWPYLDPLRAQRNLYTSWFMLARGLGAEGVRDCPYLLRNGEVYQLNPELISFDTVQFEALARSVLFGQLSRDAHEQSLLEIESLYRDSLAADIPPDEFIESKMAGFRSKMVDVLLFETRKRRASGELEKALFCVQSAFDLDETREDVFRELMDTQFEAGQRTLAMQTYFSCKQYLADELGILPSKRTTALYQDLLLDNSR